ncbi:MAG: thioredoxin domain-containing protein [Pyrinomonadaceae bacterium]
MLKIVSLNRVVSAATLGAFALLLVMSAGAQTRRPRPRTRPAAPKPTATPGPTAQPSNTPTSEALAIVNGQTITAADIEAEVRAAISQDADPYLRAFFEDSDKEIAEARRRALDARINSLLIATEAKKQRKTVEEFRGLEIDSRITPPTEEEISAVYEANRRAFGDATMDGVRAQIITYLRTRRAEDLYASLATRLRMTNLVTRGADVNAPNLQPSTTLTTVAGTPITAGPLNERMKAYAFKHRLRIYEIKKGIVDRKINDLLLIAEASKKNIAPEEIVRTEVTGQLKPATEAEIRKFYEENKARINGELASSRAEIAKYLEDQELARLERVLSARVRAGASFRIMLSEPEPPIQSISADDDPARGDQNAPVRVVEFTDFQCSACGAMYPLLEEVLKSHEKNVHFVVRDFPLAMHPNARKAAEAAAAAHAQGKFFDYIALLFKNQNALEVPSLKKYASDLGLDRKRFDMELDNGVYAAEVQHDVEEGEAYGIEGTPTIYINGVMLREFTPEGIHAAINRALSRKTQASRP